MAAIFSYVQDAVASGDPASATFSTTPVEGNLLIAVGQERSGGSAASFTITGSGWTKTIARTIQQANATYRRTLVVWWKVAGASEPTNIQIDDGTSNTKYLLIQEIGTDTDVTWALETSVSNDNGTTAGATSLGTGTTGSAPSGNLLLVGVGGLKYSNAGGTTPPASFSSTALTVDAYSNSGGFVMWTALGWTQIDPGSGTYSSTVSWGSAPGNNGLSAALLVFSGTEAGSGSTGTVAVTLANATLSAAGTTTVLGTLASTLAAATLAAAGTTTVLGSLAETLDNATLSASGSVGSPVTGTVSETLDNATLAASGTTTVRGTLAQTLANVTLSAAGTTRVQGSVNVTLGNDTLAASGAVGSAVSGSVSLTLANATLAAAGTTTIIGTVSTTTEGMTSTTSGTTTILGTLAVTLGNATLNATGTSGTTPTGAAWRFLRVWISKLGM